MLWVLLRMPEMWGLSRAKMNLMGYSFREKKRIETNRDLGYRNGDFGLRNGRGLPRITLQKTPMVMKGSEKKTHCSIEL